MPGGPIDIEFGPELVIHTMTLAERQTAAGVDGSGAPVEAWANLLNGLPFPCTVHLLPKGDNAFGQAVLEYEGAVYIPPLVKQGAQWVQDNLAGTIPDIRIRDRLTWGNWPNVLQNGQPVPRRLIVAPPPQGRQLNPLDNNSLLVVWVSARSPG